MCERFIYSTVNAKQFSFTSSASVMSSIPTKCPLLWLCTKLDREKYTKENLENILYKLITYCLKLKFLRYHFKSLCKPLQTQTLNCHHQVQKKTKNNPSPQNLTVVNSVKEIHKSYLECAYRKQLFPPPTPLNVC